MNQRVYSDYFEDILKSIKEIEQFVKNISFAEFINDPKTINAVIRSLEIIGEAAKNIPPKEKLKHPDIPWQKITAMRNKLIHEYFGVDLEIIWQTIKKDVPQIKSFLSR